MYLMKRLITIILTTILVIPAFAAEDVRDLLVQKFEQTDYHNLPLINGTAQVYGSEFRSKNASVKGKVVVVNKEAMYSTLLNYINDYIFYGKSF